MKDFARTLRQEATRSERLLWGCLRKHRLEGVGFRRQQVIGPYIADFCCFGKRLLIEIDGCAHDHPEKIRYDLLRQQYLEKSGFSIIRFTANEVEENLEGVVRVIASFLKESPPP